MSLLPADQYAGIIAAVPVLCVDVVLQVPDGRFLVVKRQNEPRSGEWWVVGKSLVPSGMACS